MINLLPPEVKESVRFAKLNVVMLQYVFVFILVGIVIAGMMLLGKASLEDTKEAAQKQVFVSEDVNTEIELVAQEARDLSSTINIVRDIFDSEIKYSLVLKEIGAIIPQDVILTSLTLGEDTSQPIQLSISMTSAELAGVLQENIIASEIFLSADILEVTRGGAIGFSSNLQAYFNPLTPLNSLGEVEPVVQAPEPEPVESPDEQPAEESSQSSETEDESNDDSSSGGTL